MQKKLQLAVLALCLATTAYAQESLNTGSLSRYDCVCSGIPKHFCFGEGRAGYR